MVSAEGREAAMEAVGPKNTQAVIKHSTFAGSGTGDFPEYRSMVGLCLSLYNKAVFAVFQGEAQLSFILGIDDTTTLNVVAK